MIGGQRQQPLAKRVENLEQEMRQALQAKPIDYMHVGLLTEVAHGLLAKVPSAAVKLELKLLAISAAGSNALKAA